MQGGQISNQSEFNSFKSISDVVKNIENKLSTHLIT